MLLENIVELFDAKKINEELDAIINKLDLYEDVKIDPIDKKSSIKQLMDLMGDAILRFTAARKGMGIVNKLKDPADRKKHASKVMSNINKLRGLMSRLDKAIAKASGGKSTVNEAAGGGKLKNMDKEAQAVWAAKGLDAKKAAINSMIDKFYAKDKQSTFKRRIEQAKSANEIDKMASNVMLSDTDKVIK